MVSRSHHGCTRCKKRRQRCDEGKPSCGRCTEAGTACAYAIVLKWEGRVPRTQPETKPKKQESEIDLDQSNLELITSSSTTAFTPRDMGIILFPGLNPLDVLAPTEKRLLHHFITEASQIASHGQLRDQICRQILPMALQMPSLMYATMALSALHQSTLLNNLPDHFIPEAMVSNLLSMAFSALREELQSKDSSPSFGLLHTIRTLCVCEIYSGKADSTWRVHVDGARAILDSLQSSDKQFDEEANWLSARWYMSMEALSALTDRGSNLRQIHTQQNSQAMIRLKSCTDAELDLYTGYSSDLNMVFNEIGRLRWRRRQLDMESNLESELELNMEAYNLETLVRNMIYRDSEEGLKIPSNVCLQEEELQQFSACNAAYQHSALIYIYRRIYKIDVCSAEVQACVKKILESVCNILPIVALSPWALLTTPIFLAGCEALGQDREIVKQLLMELYETLRIRNILRAINILEARWEQSVETLEVQIGEMELVDFIPY